MKNKIFIPIVVILLVALYTGVSNYSLKEINTEDLDVSKFIEIADEVSENKAQINWKYVASIIGVIQKNNFKSVDTDKIKYISNLFLEESTDEYKLNNLDLVLDKLNLKKKEKNRVTNYIEDLKYFGLKPERLGADTKYTKFIDNLKDDAIDNYKTYKVLPSITIAQAILESGWGESSLAKDYNNLFGIKADIYWSGSSVTLETTEFEDTKINDKFRKYDNQGDSLKDHAKFLAENKRYKNNGVFDMNTYIYQAKALEKAGYSTAMDENGKKLYASRLIEIIRQYNLQIIDSEVQSENLK
ncbi:glucosaminidase [Romboutsia weinsteinii]|uniref:Glucosaminidase n=1 Tax=Romboutsia weinsteinii TaxID=2020949 RepID=A0A371J9B0_9FIRM|nr:glucosaminidase domain-containing protein [Romboutsia weinsteinii]RDY29352.1 glucosaminidase [Romboutsia weinsteinii]